MMLRRSFCVLAVVAAAFGSSAVAAPPPTDDPTLVADAKAFGAQEAVNAPDLSADGTHVIYVTPGPGRKSIAVIGDLGTGQFAQVVASDGQPDIMRWCALASASRAVCQISGTTLKSISNEPIGFTRLVSINSNGSDLKLLGQSDSFYDAWLRQFDAAIIDRLDGTDNKLLLERQYVPEEGKLGTRLVRTKAGLGVDRIDVKSLMSQNVEEPRQGASNYMSDGQGHVRLMEVPDVAAMTGYMSGRKSYLYRV